MSDLAIFRATSLADAISRIRSSARPGKAFMSWLGEGGRAGAMTWGEADARIDAWGRQFHAWKLAAGDRVLVATRDDGAAATAVLACLTWGFPAVLLDPAGTGPETRPLLAIARPAASIVDAALLSTWGMETAGRVVSLVHGTPAGAAAPPPVASWAARLLRRAPAPAPADAETPPPPLKFPDAAEAYVLFTSGSTSRPKGVRISRGALLAHIRTLVRQLRHDAETRVFNTLPLHHADGFAQGFALAFLAGATCLRPMRFEVPTVEDYCAALYRDRATHLVAVPAMLSILLEQAEGLEDTFEARDFRGVISTGGALDERLWTKFEERFRVRVANVYGLTETVTGGCFAGPDEASRRLGTVGKPVDCEVQVTDDAGQALPPGTPGELRMRGSNLMLGYLDNPEATTAVLRDGWFRTGDLATVDPEGFVRIVGRLKSVVISGGLNIQPEEVDDVLRGVPGVRDAATFGLPDARFGEILVGCVEVLPGSGLTETAMVDVCREKLSAFKVPKSLAIVEQLPRGPAGKVAIPAARKLFEESRRPGDASPGPSSENPGERIRALAGEVFHVAPASLGPASSTTNTPGWDSFGHLAFVEALEGAFRVRLGTREVMAMKTIADAEGLVRSKLKSEGR